MIATLGRAAFWRLFLRAVDGSPKGSAVADARDVLADRRLLSFARGLSLGALVGAAIAGSAIWARVHRQSS